jgi:hypothetical protein
METTMKNYAAVKQEAITRDIEVSSRVDLIQFRKNGIVVAWMFAPIGDDGIWRGYSKDELSGIKRGRKGEVADWCLDIAANDY